MKPEVRPRKGRTKEKEARPRMGRGIFIREREKKGIPAREQAKE